jgi:hypothetical protein
MIRAAEILDYLSSRASIKSADIQEGARKAIGLAYDLLWSPVTVPKAVISYGLGLTPVRALVLTPLHLLQRSSSVRRGYTCLSPMLKKIPVTGHC